MTMASRVDDSSDVAMPPKDLAELEVDSTASENLSVLCVKRGIANSQGLSSTVVKVAPDAPSTVQVDLPGVEGSNDARAHALDLENKALAAELTQSFAREARLRAHATALTERLHEASSVQVHPESVEFKEVNLLRQHVRRLQDMVDEVERGRQQAVFKISELATKVAANGEDHVEVEWIQKAKHDFELLNQRTRLLLAQQEERHAAALDVAMRRLALEHAAAIDKLRLDHDIQLTEWRHEESRRMKEVEAAMEADK
ncbi:hypothetical protein DYB32_000174 [Aphanomyces invadans]|uniref:Uncharacterized protein n=1 Tax=Aphanomyces invadans TaxID=157072 RepID=A0A418BAV0_9STRA|nr:hypothetical protein DYB32_000174 [Aphanomyces invadans]